MSHFQSSVWQRLAGKIADQVLAIPFRKDTLEQNTSGLEVTDEIARYLNDYVVGTPWANQLAFIAAVLTVRGMSEKTIFAILWCLHPRFKALFQALGLKTMDEWKAEYIPTYLQGELLSDHAQTMRLTFWQRYSSASRNAHDWLDGLPTTDRPMYQQFALPVIDIKDAGSLVTKYDLLRRQRQTQQARTEEVVSWFAAIHAAAHMRYNQLARVHQAYHNALRLAQSDSSRLPLAFSYEEGAEPEQGVFAQEQLYFRLWDRRSFVLAHQAGFSKSAVLVAKKGRGTFTDDVQSLLLEFVRSERPAVDDPPVGLWFAELLQRDVLGENALWGAQRVLVAKQDWLRAWGYGEAGNDRRLAPFRATVPGLFAWPHNGSPQFVSKAQPQAKGVLVPIESLFAAASFGLLALDLLTTTKMPLDAMRYVRLTEECLVRLELPVSQDAKKSSVPVRYIVRIMSQSKPSARPHDYFIGKETSRLIRLVAEMLTEHYGLTEAEQLPLIPIDSSTGKSIAAPQDRYLFQYNHRLLSEQDIAACMRFLLHGIMFQNQDGETIQLKEDILKYILVAMRLETGQMPLDIIGELLKHKDTHAFDNQNQAAIQDRTDETDRYLARFAARINVEEALRLSSTEWQQAYEEAKRKAGIWSEIVGGDCTGQDCCAATFAGIGCDRKVLDPSRRYQIERYRQWAMQEIAFATQEGLPAHAEQLRRIVRGCEFDLWRMDQIEAYQRDQDRDTHFHIESYAIAQ